MATRFTTEEVLVFVTGDDDFGLSDSETSKDSDGAIHAYRGIVQISCWRSYS